MSQITGNKIKIEDKNFTLLFTHQEIGDKIEEVSKQLYNYLSHNAVVVCVIKGGFYFFSKLLTYFNNLPLEIDFISVSSYKGNTSQSKNIEIYYNQISPNSFQSKKILLVDDIADSGNTIKVLKEYFADKQCEELKVATLCAKPNMAQKVDYYCFETDGFLIGCGMDYKEQGRNLNSIYSLENS